MWKKSGFVFAVIFLFSFSVSEAAIRDFNALIKIEGLLPEDLASVKGMVLIPEIEGESSWPIELDKNVLRARIRLDDSVQSLYHVQFALVGKLKSDGSEVKCTGQQSVLVDITGKNFILRGVPEE